jgi:hypothetical protein
MRDKLKEIDWKHYHFSPVVDRRTKKVIGHGTTKDFAIDALKTFNWGMRSELLDVTPLSNGGAIVVVKVTIIDKEKNILSEGIASISSGSDNFDYAWHGQKASTFAMKYAVELALGLTSGETNEIWDELEFKDNDKQKKTTYTEPDLEPDKPENMPAEDDSLNAELLG